MPFYCKIPRVNLRLGKGKNGHDWASSTVPITSEFYITWARLLGTETKYLPTTHFVLKQIYPNSWTVNNSRFKSSSQWLTCIIGHAKYCIPVHLYHISWVFHFHTTLSYFMQFVVCSWLCNSVCWSYKTTLCGFLNSFENGPWLTQATDRCRNSRPEPDTMSYFWTWIIGISYPWSNQPAWRQIALWIERWPYQHQQHFLKTKEQK